MWVDLPIALVSGICRRRLNAYGTLLYSLHLPYAILVHHFDHVAGRCNHQPLLHLCNALQAEPAAVTAQQLHYSAHQGSCINSSLDTRSNDNPHLFHQLQGLGLCHIWVPQPVAQ